MGDALEKMMYIAIYTIIFFTAVFFLVTFSKIGYVQETAINKEFQKKSSVTVVDIEKVNTSYITQSAPAVKVAVIEKIKNMTDDEILSTAIQYEIDSYVLTREDMYKIKRGDAEYLKRLASLLDGHDNYRVIYTFNNDLDVVYYKYIGE